MQQNLKTIIFSGQIYNILQWSSKRYHDVQSVHIWSLIVYVQIHFNTLSFDREHKPTKKLYIVSWNRSKKHRKWKFYQSASYKMAIRHWNNTERRMKKKKQKIAPKSRTISCKEIIRQQLQLGVITLCRFYDIWNKR